MIILFVSNQNVSIFLKQARVDDVIVVNVIKSPNFSSVVMVNRRDLLSSIYGYLSSLVNSQAAKVPLAKVIQKVDAGQNDYDE